MKPQLIAIFAVLAFTPLLTLVHFGARLIEDSQRQIDQSFEAVVDQRLEDFVSAVEGLIKEKSRGLTQLAEAFPDEIDEIRALSRGATRFQYALTLDARGRLSFPPLEGPKSAGERAFLERTRPLWEKQSWPWRRGIEAGDDPRSGWHIWYWGDGLNLIFWHQRRDGRAVLIEVDRVRLLSEIVNLLPTTQPGAHQARMRLLDASGRVIYEWGDAAGPTERARPLSTPLEGWRFAWSGALPEVQRPRLQYLLLGALGLLLLSLAAYFYVENGRELRRAAQRVSFVNQVSHELKTPLTNIRMYAELLEEELVEEDEALRRYVTIITRESQRLSRLIANILTFAREQRGRLALRRARGRVDEVIRATLEEHAPGLEANGITARLRLAAPSEAWIDADALAQILGNLLSNVEKYARGAPIEIESWEAGGAAWVRLTDGGPGIAKAHHHQIFEPFYRLSDALNEGASGTGIGLSIARELARRHGGELRLIPSPRGACFLLHLRTQGDPPS
ncbi:HAMP domain-containing histidine kinase [Myxococcota bacterium]|nr:HAMP domain-containing histidine kinase [Myxococcota bacterium]MBU1431769.1 HAMP domain-containing histidine kinase [Myxococcota bacterium]MBU1897464.1 HAMP domain-containing histidine kinase [Myxococcota bacterium]